MNRKIIFIIACTAATSVLFLVNALSYSAPAIKLGGEITDKNSSKPLQLKAPADEMTFEPPEPSTVQGALGQLKIFNFWPGRVAHVFDVPNIQGNYPSYLVLHTLEGLDHNGKKDNDGLSDLSYQIKRPIDKSLDQYGTRVVFDPQFSPNGRFILFKFGSARNTYGTYRLYVFDTRANSLKLVSKKYLTYAITSWSPDGNYITFVEGGDFEGGVNQLNYYIGPLRLYVCNWRTGDEHLVTSSDFIRGPFSWTAPHTLIYGALSNAGEKLLKAQWDAQAELASRQSQLDPKSPKRAVNPNHDAAKEAPQPNVYEYSVENRRSQLLFKDGYRPVPSPDGHWIAFYGSEHPDKPDALRIGWEDSPQGTALSVARRDGTERVALDRTSHYPFVFWMPDNRHLLTLQTVQSSPNAQAQVKEWDLKTKRFRLVATLRAKDYKEFMRSPVEPQFSALSLAHDGTTLFVSIAEYTGRKTDSAYLISKRSLQAVDLSTGKVTPIAETQNDLGIDWFPEPDNSKVQTQKSENQ